MKATLAKMQAEAKAHEASEASEAAPEASRKRRRIPTAK